MAFSVTTQWQLSSDAEVLEDGEFCRDHTITFGSGQTVQASSAPEYKGNPSKMNPEEGLLAALSSCHMITFLTIAHLKRLTVLSYTDECHAELGKLESGKQAITKMTLKPKVIFADETAISVEVLNKIHEKAHANCFISNSLACNIEIIPTL